MIFRPNARVRLQPRAEEFAQTALLISRLPPEEPDPSQPPQPTTTAPVESIPEALERNAEQQLELNRRRDSLPQEEFEQQRSVLSQERRRLNTAAANAAAESPAAQRPDTVSGAADDLSAIGDVQPLSLDIERNGIYAADTCTIQIDYRDMPFDPRIMRAVHVEVLLGLVTPEDYEAGSERNERRADGSLRSAFSKQPDGSILAGTRFVGFVDDWSVRYSEEGDTVTLECRDMSAIPRDIALAPGQSVNLALPIDEGVRDFLNRASPATLNVDVVYEGPRPIPVPAVALGTKRFPRRGTTKRRARRGDQDMSLWDHLTDVCQSIGLVIFTRDFEIVIGVLRPFTGTGNTPRMVYGQNIKELNFTRRLQGQKVPTIEMRSFDSVSGRTRWARFPSVDGQPSSGILGINNPPAPSRANDVPPSGSNPGEKVMVIPGPPGADAETLELFAQNIFLQLGRQEIEGSLETYDIDFYKEVPDPLGADLLLANPGEELEVLIVAGVPPGFEDRGPNISAAELEAFSRQRRKEYFVSIGWPEDVAETWSALQEATAYQVAFEIQDIGFSWDRDTGIKIALTFRNFVSEREENISPESLEAILAASEGEGAP